MNEKPNLDNENTLSPSESIKKILIKEGLKGDDDEIEDHLLEQLNLVKERLGIRDPKLVESFVVLGYGLDTEIERSKTIAETITAFKKEIDEMTLLFLKNDFLEPDQEQLLLVRENTAKNLYLDGFFVDAYIEAIEERKKFMHSTPGYEVKVDTATGLVQNGTTTDV